MTRLLKCCENAAQIDASDDDQLTPLMLAAKKGDEKITQLFIDSRADVNATYMSPLTPLMCAVSQGHDIIALTMEQMLMRETKTSRLH